jgi:hypothetical protein
MLTFNLILVLAFLCVSFALLAVLAFSLSCRAIAAWLRAWPNGHVARAAVAAAA